MANRNLKDLSLEELMVRDATVSDDPIERHIILHLQRLRHQNKRLKDHIQKTSGWSHLKDVELWKPFDFYHYFCTKYVERYGHEYRQIGNIVLTYQKIDEFRLGGQIPKKDYKQFIDLAFGRYFNKINLPKISHICSSRLYNHIMANVNKFVSTDDFHNLDHDLLQEQEKFDQYVNKFTA